MADPWKSLTLDDLRKAYAVREVQERFFMPKPDVIIVSPKQHKQILAMESKGRMVIAGNYEQYMLWWNEQRKAGTVTKGSKVVYCDSPKKLMGIDTADWEIVTVGTYQERHDWHEIEAMLYQRGFRYAKQSGTIKEGKPNTKRFKIS